MKRTTAGTGTKLYEGVLGLMEVTELGAEPGNQPYEILELRNYGPIDFNLLIRSNIGTR